MVPSNWKSDDICMHCLTKASKQDNDMIANSACLHNIALVVILDVNEQAR